MQYTVCNYIQSKCYKCIHVHLVRYKFGWRKLVLLTNLVLEDHFCNAIYFLLQLQFTAQVEPNL